MLNQLYFEEGINVDTLFFRLNATIKDDVSDYELQHAFELDDEQQEECHHFEVIDTTENERDGYVIEHLTNGSESYDRLVDKNSEYTLPIRQRKNDLKIKILVNMKRSRADIYAFQRAMETAVSFREKRFLNRWIMEARKDIRKYEWLLTKLSTV